MKHPRLVGNEVTKWTSYSPNHYGFSHSLGHLTGHNYSVSSVRWKQVSPTSAETVSLSLSLEKSYIKRPSTGRLLPIRYYCYCTLACVESGGRLNFSATNFFVFDIAVFAMSVWVSLVTRYFQQREEVGYKTRQPKKKSWHSIVLNVHQPRKFVTAHFVFQGGWSNRLVRESTDCKCASIDPLKKILVYRHTGILLFQSLFFSEDVHRINMALGPITGPFFRLWKRFVLPFAPLFDSSFLSLLSELSADGICY